MCCHVYSIVHIYVLNFPTDDCISREFAYAQIYMNECTTGDTMYLVILFINIYVFIFIYLFINMNDDNEDNNYFFISVCR